MENDRIKLIEAFAALLAEKPFDSITPKDVADRAGLPASRFGYLFHDTYAVAEALFEAEAKGVAESGISPEDGGEAFLLSVSFLIRYPSSAKNIVLSSGAGIYKKHVSSLAGKYFSEVVLGKLGGASPGERERDGVKFLRAAAVGLSSKELIRAEDPRQCAERYTQFFDMVTERI